MCGTVDVMVFDILVATRQPRSAPSRKHNGGNVLENVKERNLQRNTDSSLVFCGLYFPIDQSLIHLICITVEKYFLFA